MGKKFRLFELGEQWEQEKTFFQCGRLENILKSCIIVTHGAFAIFSLLVFSSIIPFKALQ
jgi:hypothetical protein